MYSYLLYNIFYIDIRHITEWGLPEVVFNEGSSAGITMIVK